MLQPDPFETPSAIQPRKTIHADGDRMEGGRSATPAKEKASDSEKITINLGFVDLGQIDLLISEGFYGNRTDFIRTAIRNQLGSHVDAVKHGRRTKDAGARDPAFQRRRSACRAGRQPEATHTGAGAGAGHDGARRDA